MKKIKPFLPFILLGIVVLFSLGNTLQYYFYTDDFAALYRVQQNFPIGWPYNYVIQFYTPIYKIFGINPQPYFVFSIITFFLTSLTVYFFIKILTKNKLISSLSSLIFATGYIGIDQFTMMNTSITNNISNINVLLVIIFYILWLQRRERQFYFASVFLYLIALTFFPFRTFPLIFFIPTIGVIFLLEFKPFAVTFFRKLINFLLEFIPFLLIPYLLGIFSYGGKPTVGVIQNYSIKNNAIHNLLNFEFFKEMFAVFGRMIFVKPVSDVFSFVPDQNFFALTGFIFFLGILLTSLLFFFGKYSLYARSLLVVLLLTIEGYVGNMILLVNFDSNGPVNRYLTMSFMYSSAIFPLFLFLILEKIGKFKWINKKLVLVVLIIPVILSFVSLSRKYQDSIIENRSMPTKNFFKQLKMYIPKLSDSNYYIFYFDNALYYPISQRFGFALLGSLMSGNANIAMQYKVPINSVSIVNSFSDFLYFVKNPPLGKKVSYYTFYGDEKGLHNTTDKVFELLKNGSNTIVPERQVNYKKNQSSFSVDIKTNNIPSITPLKVKFSLKTTPYDSSSFNFPYIDILTGNKYEEESIKNFYQNRNVNKSNIFSYLIARKNYYQKVKVEVDSEHIGKQNPGSLLVDERTDTYWLSDQHKEQMRWVKINLSETRNISRILWKQMADRIPTKYEILTSLDGISWIKAENIHASKVGSDENLIVNDFDPVDARYIKVIIEKTKDGFNPALAEVEVIDAAYSNIDLEAAVRILAKPFEYIKNEQEMEMTYAYLKDNAILKISTLTNKDGVDPNKNYNSFPIILDGMFHDYVFTIPASGTYLKLILLESNYPADVVMSNLQIENQAQE